MQNGAYDALIVIDVQTALVEAHPSDEERFIASVGALIEACRCNGVPVVYVLHDGGAGDELERGTDGWQAYAAVAPQGGEPCVGKRFNSAFRRTGLHEMLRSLGAKRLVMCGMQTEFFERCDGFELGFGDAASGRARKTICHLRQRVRDGRRPHRLLRRPHVVGAAGERHGFRDRGACRSLTCPSIRFP